MSTKTHDQSNYTFCHIPKTGGCSLHTIIKNKRPGHHRYFKNKNNFLFAFVRNPYDRCFSAFFYLKKGGMNLADKKACSLYIGNSTFTDFVEKKLIKASKNQTHFRPQHYWIPEGADFIGKYENLEQDIYKLFKILKIDTTNLEIPHKNKTEYCKPNISKKHKDIIYNIYKKDFEIFGYDYE